MTSQVISLNYFIYKSRSLSFAFRKLEFKTMFNEYLNKSPFNYFIEAFQRERDLMPCLFCLLGVWGVQNLGRPSNIILAHSLLTKI